MAEAFEGPPFALFPAAGLFHGTPEFQCNHRQNGDRCSWRHTLREKKPWPAASLFLRPGSRRRASNSGGLFLLPQNIVLAAQAHAGHCRFSLPRRGEPGAEPPPRRPPDGYGYDTYSRPVVNS